MERSASGALTSIPKLYDSHSKEHGCSRLLDVCVSYMHLRLYDGQSQEQQSGCAWCMVHGAWCTPRGLDLKSIGYMRAEFTLFLCPMKIAPMSVAQAHDEEDICNVGDIVRIQYVRSVR